MLKLIDLDSKKLNLVVLGQKHNFQSNVYEIISLNNEKQSIIVDVKRTWQPLEYMKRIRYIRPTSKFEIINLIYDIESLVTPRLGFLIIDGAIGFLRDFMGREAKNVQINAKIFAFISNQLVKILGNNEIYVIITTYKSGMHVNNPLMDEVSNYYRSNTIFL